MLSEVSADMAGFGWKITDGEKESRKVSVDFASMEAANERDDVGVEEVGGHLRGAKAFITAARETGFDFSPTLIALANDTSSSTSASRSRTASRFSARVSRKARLRD